MPELTEEEYDALDEYYTKKSAKSGSVKKRNIRTRSHNPRALPRLNRS